MPSLYPTSLVFFLLLAALTSRQSWAFLVERYATPRTTALGLAAGKGFAKKNPKAILKEPLTDAEVEQWMGHVPVYAVTDAGGNGQAIAVGNDDKSAFYFFFSPVLAEAFLNQLAPTTDKELTVSGLFLGKIWYSFLQEDADDVEYRLVPDPRDLITAETILRLESDDEETKLAPYNVIPLFGVRQVHKNNKNQKVNDLLDKMVSSHYLYFGSQHRLDATNAGQHDEAEEDELVFLHEVVEKMQQQEGSTTDYRNVVLVPNAPISNGTVSDAVLAQQLADPDSFVAQTYLWPLLRE